MHRIFQANFVASLVVNFVEAGIDKDHDRVYDNVGLRVEDLAFRPSDRERDTLKRELRTRNHTPS